MPRQQTLLETGSDPIHPRRSVRRGRVRVHDPFELVRWLALSQPDPRKALAELVQNSLDAGARHVEVTRVRIKGVACLEVRDDGEGVIPELDRAEALRYLATHIGHSRKRSLTPRERMELMTQGQYGIGLLGFWSLGERLEIRALTPESSSREDDDPDQRPHRLVLFRDSPDYTIEPLHARTRDAKKNEGFTTEVVVVGLHRDALPVLAGRRAADYLAQELRGQLLARDVKLVVRDRIARGRAAKRIVVKPRRFLGERIEGLAALEVSGYVPARLELYYTGNRASHSGGDRLKLYGAGTLVADGFDELGALGLDHPPWTDSRLSGMVDFPALQVAPGSRRGVVPDRAAFAFAAALRGLEPILSALLARHESQRVEDLDKAVVRDLQAAFRDLYRQLPRYALLPVGEREDAAAGPPGDGVAARGEGDGTHGLGEGDEAADREGGAPEASAEETAEDAAALEQEEEGLRASDLGAEMLPAGSLVSARLRPVAIRVVRGGYRTVRVQPLDEYGRLLESGLEIEWRLTAECGSLEVDAERPRVVRLRASEERAEGTLSVVVRRDGAVAEASASVKVLDAIGRRGSDEGIPEPELIDAPIESWRSRMREGSWQVNAGHPSYRAIATSGALKLRYLSMLFAKEVVLRSASDARLEEPLEQLIEVAAFADRQIVEGRLGRRKA